MKVDVAKYAELLIAAVVFGATMFAGYKVLDNDVQHLYTAVETLEDQSLGARVARLEVDYRDMRAAHDDLARTVEEWRIDQAATNAVNNRVDQLVGELRIAVKDDHAPRLGEMETKYKVFIMPAIKDALYRRAPSSASTTPYSR